jgi:hypothetical protein
MNSVKQIFKFIIYKTFLRQRQRPQSATLFFHNSDKQSIQNDSSSSLGRPLHLIVGKSRINLTFGAHRLIPTV